jgi:hypothetical protein
MKMEKIETLGKQENKNNRNLTQPQSNICFATDSSYKGESTKFSHSHAGTLRSDGKCTPLIWFRLFFYENTMK